MSKYIILTGGGQSQLLGIDYTDSAHDALILWAVGQGRRPRGCAIIADTVDSATRLLESITEDALKTQSAYRVAKLLTAAADQLDKLKKYGHDFGLGSFAVTPFCYRHFSS